MKLIIGLGNLGKEYENTRHNAGFMFVDFLRKKYNFSEFKEEKKFKAEISSGDFNGEKILLVKPQTFMNLSGEAVNEVVKFYKIERKDIIVISDDKDMEFGKIRFRAVGSSGGHNGLRSIIQYLGEDFKRIKIGIGYNKSFETSDWVLSKFTYEEIKKLDEVFEEIGQLLELDKR